MTDADILIVGGGIIGLAHARAAVRRGYSVLLLDSDVRPVGASVRNFGHACVTGQTGEFADLAVSARAHWLAAAAEAGFWAREAGAHVIAHTGAELAVLEELAAGDSAPDVRMLTGRQVAQAVGVPRDDHAGGAHLSADLRVDPREAVPALARHLAGLDGVTLRYGEHVGEVGDGTVRTASGTYSAAQVLVCVGHRLRSLLPGPAVGAGLRECALAMALVDQPAGWSTDSAVLTGTSLLRYDAFSSTRAAAAVRGELATASPALLEIGANLMLAPRPDGTLVLGDSHSYAATVEPFVEEGTVRLLLDEAARLLGVDGLRVRQRWQGVYASSGSHPLVVSDVDARTRALTVATGIGMTISFGLAERTLDTL